MTHELYDWHRSLFRELVSFSVKWKYLSSKVVMRLNESVSITTALKNSNQGEKSQQQLLSLAINGQQKSVGFESGDLSCAQASSLLGLGENLSQGDLDGRRREPPAPATFTVLLNLWEPLSVPGVPTRKP